MKRKDKLDGVIIVSSLLRRVFLSPHHSHGLDQETTGLADPAPVAQTFFMDPSIEQSCKLDAIVTVVDAKHIVQHLTEEKPEGAENEAVEQVVFADRLLLNKCDLVDEAYLTEVETQIRAHNKTVCAMHNMPTVARVMCSQLLLGL
eukprot:COSAG05_NODE_1792_length_4082_cov_3.402963_6_plen_146_part_00